MREWLKELDLEDRKTIGEDIKDVEFAWPIGMPLVRSLGDELWEVRSRLPGGPDSPRYLLCRAGLYGVAPWIHEEDPKDAPARYRAGA